MGEKNTPLLVYKFGGTSVADESARNRAAAHVQRALWAGNRVVVVVSAMGRKGAPYATDTLLELVGEKPETRDLLMSCGETISACIFADTLEKSGLCALPMTAVQAGLWGSGPFSSADITNMDTAFLLEQLDKGVVPVVTGFQAMLKSHEIVTLGRGGSDTSAVEIGGYLGAQGVHIFTDVSGIAVADPRLLPDAPYLEHIGYDDIEKLAVWGAKVIHPRAVAAARRHHLPVWVRSAFDEKPGTLISGRAGAGLIGLAVLRGCLRADEKSGSYVLNGMPPVYLQPASGGAEAVITIVCYNRDNLSERIRAAVRPAPIYLQGENTLHVLTRDDDVGALIPEIYEQTLQASRVAGADDGGKR